MSDRWYYRVFGQEFGPVSLDLVRTLVNQGAIAPDDEVRDATRSNWILACAASELGDSIKSPGADLSVERRAVRDKWFCRGATGDFGPLTLSDLIQLAAIGELKPDEDVKAWADDYWKQVRSIRRLVELLPFPEPNPSASRETPLSIVVEDDSWSNDADDNTATNTSLIGEEGSAAANEGDHECDILPFPGVRSTKSISRSMNPFSSSSTSVSVSASVEDIVNSLALENFNVLARRAQNVSTLNDPARLGALLTEASAKAKRLRQPCATTTAHGNSVDVQSQRTGSMTNEASPSRPLPMRIAKRSVTSFLGNLTIDAKSIGISVLLAVGLMVLGWVSIL